VFVVRKCSASCRARRKEGQEGARVLLSALLLHQSLPIEKYAGVGVAEALGIDHGLILMVGAPEKKDGSL
jgi:hypothetical protein